MRIAKGNTAVVERKPVSALSSKLVDVMRDHIIPMARCIETLPCQTRFVFTREDMMDMVINDLKRDHPEILADKDAFLSEIQSAYDRCI